MSSKPILVETQGELALITFNIPHKLNALTNELYRELAFALRKIATMDSILVTIITGKGRYFSAGADVGSTGLKGPANSNGYFDERTYWMRNFSVNNIELTKAFLEHPKILVGALNGPAVGLSAAVTGLCDFIYMAENAFILTPFTALGLVAEGGCSETFFRRLGQSKANEALLLSKRITAQELLQCGFANKLFPKPAADSDFHKAVLNEVKENILNPNLNRESMLLVKKLIKANFAERVEKQNVVEAFGGLERFLQGVPQREFARIASGEKKHKL